MRAVAILMMLCQLTACTSWRLETLSPADVIQQRGPDALRVDLVDGHREVWYQPAIQGDSLTGWLNIYGKAPDRRVPLANIAHVSTNHVSAAKTSFLLVVLGGLIAASIAAATWDGPLGSCCAATIR